MLLLFLAVVLFIMNFDCVWMLNVIIVKHLFSLPSKSIKKYSKGVINSLVIWTSANSLSKNLVSNKINYSYYASLDFQELFRWVLSQGESHYIYLLKIWSNHYFLKTTNKKSAVKNSHCYKLCGKLYEYTFYMIKIVFLLYKMHTLHNFCYKHNICEFLLRIGK